MLDQDTQIKIAIGYLSVFSVFGVIGNALVLYVFSRFKQKLTSTIFILTLAGTDFITCFVTIPFTITVEALNFQLKYDIICQIYQFLITTTVPFSAFVMSAIAVDRYLCIVHPFKHAMTIKRAEFIVGCLCVFAVILGIICCSNYAILPMVNADATPMSYSNGTISGTSTVTQLSNITLSQEHTSEPSTGSTLNITGVFVCQPRITEGFLLYQKIYSSFFAICALVVIVLYSLIYRSVLARRRKKFKIVQNRCCGFGASLPSDGEQTEFSTLNNEVGKETGEDGKEERKESKKNDKAVQKNGSSSVSDKDIIMKPGGVSRAKLEKMRIANIKTAFMLSIVALVFIVAFLPSWLVALRTMNMNIIVFYLYFIYNVVNPVIYAFFNGTFRNHLKQLLSCKK